MGLWCRHRLQTSPRRDEAGEYCRCLDCGKRIAWAWSRNPLYRMPGFFRLRASDVLGKLLPGVLKLT